MLNSPLVATVSQRILTFLAKFSDREFYERQVARTDSSTLPGYTRNPPVTGAR